MYQPNFTPYYGQPAQPGYQAPTRQGALSLKGRPVSSIEEARAQSIDFDGSVFYFPDLANNKIYTKQINMDGTASLNMYELKEIPSAQPQDFITRQEFEKTIQRIECYLAPPPAQPAAAPEQKEPVSPQAMAKQF